VAQFFTIPQASKHLGGKPSAETLYRLVREGFLPCKRIGRLLMISEFQLDEWANTPGDARSTVYAGTAIAGEP
jgi:excisionase family DNA binding protein